MSARHEELELRVELLFCEGEIIQCVFAPVTSFLKMGTIERHKRRREKRIDVDVAVNGYSATTQQLIADWERLCARFLPIETKNSIWRFSRQLTSVDPEQGWKLHVSATILSANQVLTRIGTFLRDQNILFKATRSLEELRKLNSGLYYGFSQIGKTFTIYPIDPRDAVHLARKLHQLTLELPAPIVPYDLRFRKKSSVFYRYGGFKEIEIQNEDGRSTFAIRDEQGALIPDTRTANHAAPNWLANPFLLRSMAQSHTGTSPLQTTVRAFEALSQRGKGGVYRAVDLSANAPRLCLLKEGRRHGETDWDGRDGHWRVRHEGRVLARLASAGVTVPQVYTSFTVESHYYLVTEYIEGDNLQALLSARQRKLTLTQALQFGVQAAKLLGKIHAAGWVWRDCKPLNLIRTKSNQLRPIDFEGACLITRPDPSAWGTAGYAPPEWLDDSLPPSREPEDLFALGVTLYQLFSGEIPTTRIRASTVKKLDSKVPIAVRKIISALLNPHPQHRPRAFVVSEILKGV